MGNAPTKTNRKQGKKYVHWNNAERPTPPGKPTLVPGTPLNKPDVVTIRWEPPLNDGGAPITGYLVEHRRTGSPHWVRATPDLVIKPELSLSGLEPGWRYQFRVTAQNPTGMSEPGELSEPLTVTLQRSAAAAPFFIKELRDVIALENDKAEFLVKFRGTPLPKISWYKDGFELFSSRRTRIVTENDESSLVIFQSAFIDEGEIKCTATNRVGHIVTKGKLRLEAPPRIRLPRQYEDGLLFEMDEVIRLKVSVAGRPLPRVSWLHNGEAVQFGGRYEVANTDRNSTLRVGEARRGDRGEYQVRATNRLGEDVASVLVTVTDRPVPPGKATVVTALGRSVTLSWTIPEDDGGCKIGNYIVEYYRIGWNVWLKAATCRQLGTTLGDLIEGSEYKFRVKAENPYGVSDPSLESDVVFIPDPKRGLLEPPVRSTAVQLDEVNEQLLPREPDQGWKPPVTIETIETKKRKGEASLTADILTLESGTKKSRPKSDVDRYTPSPVLSFDKDRPEIIKRRLKDPKVQKKPTFSPTPSPESPIEREISEAKRRKGKDSIGTTVPPKQVVQKVPEQVPKDKKDVPKSVEGKMKPRFGDKDVVMQEPVKKLNALLSPLQPREDDDSLLHGSSELMLVLLPERRDTQSDSEQDHAEQFSEMFGDNDSVVAPPMSLSAPELGCSEPLVTSPLRNSVSSTELLHEKAMARFYQAVAAEEQEKSRRRRHSIEQRTEDPPLTDNKVKIRINSLETDESDFDRFKIGHPTVRRRSSVEAKKKEEEELSWHKKKPETPATVEEEKPNGGKSRKGKFSSRDINVKSILNRKEPVHLVTKEQEEQDFARLREKLASEDNNRPLQRKSQSERELEDEEEEEEEVSEVEEEESDIDEDDTMEESEEELDAAHAKGIYPRSMVERFSDDEEETYHPRSMIPKVVASEPAPTPRQVITKSADPPKPQPKPILKTKSKFEQESYPKYMEAPKKKESTPKQKESRKKQELYPKQKEIIKKQELYPKQKETIKKQESYPKQKETPFKEETYPKEMETPKKLPSKPARKNPPEEVVHKEPSPQHSKSPSPGDVVRRRKKEDPVQNQPIGGEEAETRDTDLGISAAEIARNRRLRVRQASLEDEAEARKVVASHYMDLIREYGHGKKSPTMLYLNTEDLIAAAQASDEQLSNAVSSITSPDAEAHVSDTVETYFCNQGPTSTHRTRVDPTEYNSRSATVYNKWKPPSEPVEYDDSDPEPGSLVRRVSPDQRPLTPDEERKQEIAEKNVRGFVGYMTDLAMFSVACWLYVFDNELWAIPILLLMVFRQLYEAIKKRIPARWKRKPRSES